MLQTQSTENGKSHHAMAAFQNPVLQKTPGFRDFAKLTWQMMTQKGKTVVFPLAKTDIAFLRDNRTQSTLTWIGHATFLLQNEGINVLTDPHLTSRASPLPFGFRRFTPPALDSADLPAIDIVIISHNHYDHLDKRTIHNLRRIQGDSIRWYVPLGLKRWFKKLGVDNVHEMDWWDKASWKQLNLHAVPARHFSGRGPFDRNQTLWAGWVIEFPWFKFYFVGDTGYSEDFKTIGRRLGPMDLSAIPIGAYDPRWFMSPIHVDPEQAVMIHQDVQSRYSVGMHWGTFKLTLESMDEPPKRLRERLGKEGIPEESFFVLKHGETRLLNFLEKKASVRR